MILLPDAVQNVKPLAGARVAVVVLFERNAIFARFVRPPGRNNIQSEAPFADLLIVASWLGNHPGRRNLRRTPPNKSNRSVSPAQCRSGDQPSHRGRLTPL